MTLRLFFAAIFAVATVVHTSAQKSVGMFELELSDGITTPFGSYHGGENRNAYTAAVEFRYNFPMTPVDLGVALDVTNAGRNFRNVVVDGYYNPEKVFKQKNRTTSVFITTDYNIARGNALSAFIGCGVGVAHYAAKGSVAYDSDGTNIAFMPRFGIEFINRLRLTCKAVIVRRGYNVVALTIGYTIGGRPTVF